MSDLIEETGAGANTPEYTVAEISGAVKRTIEGAFGRVRVRGEVGRVFRARSGHLYYDIKDDGNVLACTTWKGQAARLSVMPEEGLEVVVTGKLTAFGAQSKYNMNVDEVTVAGEGALMAMLERRKKALAAEGLFAPERKQPIPYLPEVIGVVTSPSGAVIRDILHRLRDRFPRKVLIWPVAVQGQACAPEVANAIRGFNAMTPGGALPRPDLIIVARGGGSIEDLWGFNEEIVARAAAASDIPLISAVGHETDTTLIDYVSDQRAPTPTAAAEMAVPVRMELMAAMAEMGARLQRAAGQGTAQRRQRLQDLARALPRPEALADQARQRLDMAAMRLPNALERTVATRRARLVQTGAALRPQVLRAAVQARRDGFSQLSKRLMPQPILLRIQSGQTRTKDVAMRVHQSAAQGIQTRRRALSAMDRLRETLGYRATLRRGYAVVRGDGAVLTTADAARGAGALEIEFADGRVAMSGDVSAAPAGGAVPEKPAAKRRAPAKKTPPEQGSLF